MPERSSNDTNDSGGALSNQTGDSTGASLKPSKTSGQGKTVPVWLRLIPFFMSAVLFLSGFFAVVSPLPLLFMRVRGGLLLSLAALAANSGLVYGVGGRTSFLVYLPFVLVLAVALGELLVRGIKLERAIALTLLAMAVVGGIQLGVNAHLQNMGIWASVKTQVFELADFVLQSLSSESRTAWLGNADPVEWKEALLLEMPSAVAILGLLLVWLNAMFLVKMNPNHLRERLGIDSSYFKRWKSPEYLLWPTIIAGFLVVIPAGVASDVAMNLFRFFMAIYALQGLSILSFVFEAWNVASFLRSVGYVVAVLLMMPLVLGLGFFDQWFDFRAKLRQS